MNQIATRFLLMLVRLYKRVLSPVLPPACRFVPTCSEYATEAIELHGAVRGSALAIWRLLRCHPFARAGFDPVPRGKTSGSEAGLETNLVDAGAQSLTKSHA